MSKENANPEELVKEDSSAESEIEALGLGGKNSSAAPECCVYCGHDSGWLGNNTKTCQKLLADRPGMQLCKCKCVYPSAMSAFRTLGVRCSEAGIEVQGFLQFTKTELEDISFAIQSIAAKRPADYVPISQRTATASALPVQAGAESSLQPLSETVSGKCQRCWPKQPEAKD